MKTVKAWLVAALVGVGLQGVTLGTQAAVFSLQWNSSVEPNVVQYRVYVGNGSRQYDRSYPVVGNALNISDLPAGPTYFFAVTAVNNAGLESAYSEEVSSSGEAGVTLASTVSSTSLRLTVNADPGSSVVFESSTNLVNWQTHSSVTANPQGVATLNQARSSLGPLRFFRVRLP